MSRRWSSCIAAASCVGALLLSGCADQATPVAVEPAAIDFDALDTDLEAWADELPGGAVGLVRLTDGRTHFIEVGEDATSGAHLSVDDPVRVGSISKIYTATSRPNDR